MIIMDKSAKVKEHYGAEMFNNLRTTLKRNGTRTSFDVVNPVLSKMPKKRRQVALFLNDFKQL